MSDDLRAAHERALSRLRFAQRELAHYRKQDCFDPHALVILERLQAAVVSAQRDVGYAQRDLQAAAMSFTFSKV